MTFTRSDACNFGISPQFHEAPVTRHKRGLCIGMGVVALALSGASVAGPDFSDWSGSTFTGLPGGCPIESRSGNELFIAGGFDGTLDIFYYQRQGKTEAFDALSRKKAADPVSDPAADDFCPTPLPGNVLLFVSNRGGDGSCGGTDIYASRYNPGKDGWSAPRNLGCAPDGPNTAGNELSPSLVKTEAGTLLYFSSGPENPSAPIYVTGQDIYQSRMLMDGSFEPGVAVTTLNTNDADRQPNVGRNGLEIVFASNRDADGVGDIWYASRNSVFEDWSVPVNLSDTVPFVTAGEGESRPSFSWDRTRLYYGSGGVHVSTRRPGN